MDQPAGWLRAQAPPAPRPLARLRHPSYSRLDSCSMAHSRVGTLYYMAPDVICCLEGQYNAKKADVWSCGVVLYYMCEGPAAA